MIRKQRFTRAQLAKQLGISRASLYYTSKQLPKDWALKKRIEEVLEKYPSYGSPRVAIELGINESVWRQPKNREVQNTAPNVDSIRIKAV